MSTSQLGQAKEVDWYRRNGRFPNMRIALDGDGNPYVIGDHAWNKAGRPKEFVEGRMDDEVWKPLRSKEGIR